MLSKPADDKLNLLLFERIKELNQTMDSSLKGLNQTVDSKLAQSTQQMQSQFNQSISIVKGITEKMTELQETNKQVMGFSAQLKNLEKVLTSQKQRGNLGEAALQLVLENILPPTSFMLQYKFDDGDIVDAVIKTKDGLIPVDAKFSLDNYNRVINEDDEEKRLVYEKEFKNDLKKRIDETSKYIKPSKGTMDFAFMFIPAEAIYYDLLVNEVGAIKINTRSLIDYAFKEKRVIIVSPTTFAAYLQTVLQGLRALKIEEQTKQITKWVEMLQKHISAYDDYFKKLGNSLNTTVNAYNTADKEFKKIDKDVVKITGVEGVIEPLQLDGPKKVDSND
ncbi:MAG: DNA recombination protein RmuC [Candidatus Buchananbacteria bacterium]|nr:DNA recombination protein RmuC [Candidatus Buchananbacteria bacterium]